jgi:hypothetical protein
MSHLYSLPRYFILKRFKADVQRVYPELASHCEDAILISTNMIGTNLSVYDTTLVQRPLSVLGNSFIMETNDRWFDGHKVAFTMKCGDKIMPCTFEFNKLVVQSNIGSIPVLRQSSPCELYGNTFTFLHTDMYESYRFPCKTRTVLEAPLAAEGGGGGLPIAPPINPRASSGKIPQHILNTYIQTLVDKQENCPIEMTPLTKETARITPCGHSMSASAAEYWIAYKHSCPVCREQCSVAELQKWV